jgi:hypothetical protein
MAITGSIALTQAAVDGGYAQLPLHTTSVVFSSLCSVGREAHGLEVTG